MENTEQIPASAPINTSTLAWKPEQNGYFVGKRAFTQEWTWNGDTFLIRPYALDRIDLSVYSNEAQEIIRKNTIWQKQIDALSDGLGELEAEIFLAELNDDPSGKEKAALEKSKGKLQKINDRIAQLQSFKVDLLEFKAKRFFLTIIARWELTEKNEKGEDVAIPLNPAGVMGLDPRLSDALEAALVDFLFG